MSNRKKNCSNDKKHKKKYLKSINRRKIKSDRCANPFNVKGHRGRSLRKVSKILLSQFKGLTPQAKICGPCRKHSVAVGLCTNRSQNNQFGPNSSGKYKTKKSNQNPPTINKDKNIPNIPVQQTPSTSADYFQQQNIEGSNLDNENEIDDAAGASDFKVVFENLKKSFSTLKENDPLRLRILTIVPETWSIRKTAKEFDTTQHYVRRARELLANGGLFAEVPMKSGKLLPHSTIEAVTAFYNSDEVSRSTSSSKEYVSMKVEGKKKHVQKRLLLLSLKELWVSFKKKHADYPISFSMFAKQRPKNCILPGHSGTHCVCVCTIHQNVKTMLDAIDLQNLTANEEIKLNDYKDCLKTIVCEGATDECFFNECNDCPGIKRLEVYLKNLLEKNSVLEVKYAIWTETDRSTLVNHLENVTDFVENLCDRLEKLKPHSHIAKKQSLFIKNRKQNLAVDEVLVCFDFSENYAYVAQDAAQAFHYNNDQCTVFPVIYYFKRKSKIVHRSLIFLSECTKHDTAAVDTILIKLIPEIKKEVGKVKKIIYVSDGAKQHFKNGFQMSNLKNHKEDFDIDAEWHFTPTAHGKSGHDGLAACFKREARRSSLKAKPCDAILNAESLYSWAKQYFKGVKIFRFSKAEHDRICVKLEKRFQEAAPLVGIMRYHSFTVLENKLEMKRFSTA